MALLTAGRILVIEPDPATRTAYVQALEADGYAVVVAEDGGDGLSLMDDKFDLVIVERDLPDMDGLKVAIEVRRRRTLRHVPVLMTAARVRKLDSSFVAGVDEAMYKPVDPKKLVQSCGCLLKARLIANPIDRRNEYQRLLHLPEMDLKV